MQQGMQYARQTCVTALLYSGVKNFKWSGQCTVEWAACWSKLFMFLSIQSSGVHNVMPRINFCCAVKTEI